MNQNVFYGLFLTMDLKERISCLPLSIQILISEFNVEHRVFFRNIIREYFELIYPLCRMCSAPFDKPFCTIDFFIIQKYKLNCHWCNIACFEKEPDQDLKLKCLKAVEEYTAREDW